MNKLIQDIKCLFGYHKIALKMAVTYGSKRQYHFVCINCGKHIGKL